MNCYRCGFEIDTTEKIGRRNECPKCGSYLHCCKNCRFYDMNAHHQCREPQAEWVREKEMGNFCDYFAPGESRTSGQIDKAAEARKKLEELFKKKGS